MLHGPAGLVVFSCGIRLTPLESMTDSCFLANTLKKPSIGSVQFNKQSIHKKVPVLAICYYSVLSGPHVVTLIIQFLLVLPL